MIVLLFVSVAVVAYLLGSFNTAVIVSKTVLKDDIRSHGSGNAGATNALRVMGKKLAALVAAGDILKGILAIMFADWMFPDYVPARMLAAAFVVLGHVYPVFFRFKGGKGVATTAAVILMVDWRVFLVCLVVFIAVVAATRISALGSMLSATCIPFALWYMNSDFITIAVSAAIAVFVIFLHRSNIKRIMNGTENKVFSKKEI